MELGYKAKQVVRITAVRYQTLHYWAKSGFIRPSILQASGTGSARIYSFQDLVALRVARELRASGISKQSLEKVIQYLRTEKLLENPLAEARLVIVGKDVLTCSGQQELVSALSRPGQSCLAFVLDMERTFKEVREAAAYTETPRIGPKRSRGHPGRPERKVAQGI